MSVNVGESRAMQMSATACVNCALSIEWLMVEISRNRDLGEQTRPRNAILNSFGNSCDQLGIMTVGALIYNSVEIFDVEACRHELITAILKQLPPRNANSTAARARQLILRWCLRNNRHPR